MAYKTIYKEWCIEQEEYQYCFVLDSDEDAASLPAACPGSVAMVANSGGKVYMVNASGEWRDL